MSDNTSQDKQALRKKNLRMALVLASVAAVFFVGFIVKYMLLSK